MRIIPPPRPCTPPPPAAPSLPPGPARLLRRPPEKHPLQDSEIGPQLLQLSIPFRVPRSHPRDLLPQQCLPPGPLASADSCRFACNTSANSVPRTAPQQPSHPRQRSRNYHAAQQSSSAAANHAPHASVSQPSNPQTPVDPSQDFRVLTAAEWPNCELAAGECFSSRRRDEKRSPVNGI